jgi:hypothetical protein
MASLTNEAAEQEVMAMRSERQRGCALLLRTRAFARQRLLVAMTPTLRLVTHLLGWPLTRTSEPLSCPIHAVIGRLDLTYWDRHRWGHPLSASHQQVLRIWAESWHLAYNPAIHSPTAAMAHSPTLPLSHSPLLPHNRLVPRSSLHTILPLGSLRPS